MSTTFERQPVRARPAGVAGKAARRPKKLGPVAAVILAVAVGQFTMGVFTLLDQWLNPTEWIPVPGVTPFTKLEGGTKMLLMWSNYAVMTGLLVQTVLGFLITWTIAHEAIGKRRHIGRKVWVASGILFVVGLVCTFPPFYNWLIPG